MFDDYCDDMDGFVYGLDVEDLAPASEVLGSGSVHVSAWRYFYVVYADSNNRIHGGSYFGKSFKGVTRYVLDSEDGRKILFIHDFSTRKTMCFLEKENC
jgi:hypothetical protein